MNITYVVTKKEKEEFSDLTIKSIESNIKNEDKILKVSFSDNENDSLLYFTLNNKENSSYFEKSDYVVIVPNKSYLETKFREIAEEYVQGNNEVYLPFAILIAEDNTKGLLNTSMWTNYALEVGFLDHELALMQSDTILFGAIIPKEILFDNSHYNSDLKYFQHFHFINSISSQEQIIVKGIPKVLTNLDYDLTFNNIDKEEKLANYKLAREKFVKALEVNG